MKTPTSLAALAALFAATSALPAAAQPAHKPIHNIVLVHGGFVDGSGWRGVHDILKRDGYNVVVVQNSTISLADDANTTRNALAQLKGPAVLVGHSYGGAVISEAGTDDHVRALVYIAAFAPDTGESVVKLTSNPAPGAPVPPILPPQDGYLFLDRTKFAASFAADVKPAEAEFMANSQVPWGLNAATGMVTTPAWRGRPTYYLVAKDDRMIPPPVQRMMAARAKAKIEEAPGSHAIYVSNPQVVATFIERAAREASGE